jgi:hypothetical protein
VVVVQLEASCDSEMTAPSDGTTPIEIKIAAEIFVIRFVDIEASQ